MDRSSRLAFVLLMLTGVGCRSHQLAQDQDQFRSVLLELYTNQIIDNLIRTKNGLPIIQLDYTNICGQLTQNATGSFMNAQTAVSGKTLALPTIAYNLSHMFTNASTFGFSAMQSNQMSVTANPVINNNEVYNAYIQFVTMPGRFVVTCEKPPPGAAHIVRKCGDAYYWVPCEYKYDFFRLALVTTAQRGQPLDIPLSFAAKVVNTVRDDPTPEPGMGVARFVITFDTKIPNGTGWMTANINGTDQRFRLQLYHPDTPNEAAPTTLEPIPGPKGEVVPVGQPTNTFWLEFDGTKLGMPATRLPKLLKDQSVKIDLDFFKPTIPTTEKLLDSLRNEVQLIRFNQVNPAFSSH